MNKSLRVPASTTRLLLVLGLVVLIYVVYRSGLHNDLDIDALRSRVQAWGAWGPVGLVLVTSILQPLHISIYVFLISAVVIYGPLLGGLISWVAILGASCTSFGFSRYVARDWVQERVPDRFKRFDERLETKGLKTILMLRLVFFTTPMLQLALGVTRVPFRTYLLGSAIGVLPWLVASVLLASKISSWLSAG